MRSRITIDELDLTNNQNVSALQTIHDSPVDIDKRSTSLSATATEGRDVFMNYIDYLGLPKDQEIVVLSSMHHYFYGAEELNHVKTVINLKELNSIKHIEEFISSLYHILAPGTRFLGCFIDLRKIHGYSRERSEMVYHSRNRSEAIENGIVSRIPLLNMFYSIVDLRPVNFLSKRNVISLLENRGFKVMDLTDMNGRTFFCTQKSLNNSN